MLYLQALITLLQKSPIIHFGLGVGAFGVAALEAGSFGAMAATAAMSMGAGLVMGGVAGLLTPQPTNANPAAANAQNTSYYFNGPVNTTMQGVPVQLIYGRCLVGSHAISASMTVN